MTFVCDSNNHIFLLEEPDLENRTYSNVVVISDGDLMVARGAQEPNLLVNGPPMHIPSSLIKLQLVPPTHIELPISKEFINNISA